MLELVAYITKKSGVSDVLRGSYEETVQWNLAYRPRHQTALLHTTAI